MPEFEKMTESKLRGAIQHEIRDAEDLRDGEVQTDREKALRAYRREKNGTEREGYSQVVASDVSDTIEALLPDLLRPFVASSKIGEFAPVTEEDEAFCEQASDYINYMFFNENNGGEKIYIAVKDALMQKTGILKAWWEVKEDVEYRSYSGLSIDDAIVLLEEPGQEIVWQEEREDGLHNLRLKQKRERGTLVVDVIPPEEFLVSKKCRNDLDEAPMCGHVIRRTVSDLIAMGYDKDKLDEIPTGSEQDINSLSEERKHDHSYDDQNGENPDPAMREIEIYELYMRVDFDGDGVAELRRIVCGGGKYTILENEPVDQHPFTMLCPIWRSHEAIGDAVADQVRDIQELRTSLWRQMLDNLYLVNQPRTVVRENSANLNDLLNPRIGGVIRVKKDAPQDAVKEIATPFAAGQTFPMMEFLDKMREERTGVSRNSTGLDPDILQNVTAAAISQTAQGMQSRKEMIARLLGWGLKRLLKKMLRITVNHQDKERTVKLRNKWVKIDPRQWRAEMDCTVDVGLGTGDKDEKVRSLSLILNKQEQILMKLGPDNPMVSIKEYRDTLGKLINEIGFVNDQAFFKEFDEALLAQQGGQEPKPDPKMIEVERKLQLQKEKQDADIALKERELLMKQELRREEMHMEYQLELAKIGRGEATNGNINRGGF